MTAGLRRTRHGWAVEPPGSVPERSPPRSRPGPRRPPALRMPRCASGLDLLRVRVNGISATNSAGLPPAGRCRRGALTTTISALGFRSRGSRGQVVHDLSEPRTPVGGTLPRFKREAARPERIGTGRCRPQSRLGHHAGAASLSTSSAASVRKCARIFARAADSSSPWSVFSQKMNRSVGRPSAYWYPSTSTMIPAAVRW